MRDQDCHPGSPGCKSPRLHCQVGFMSNGFIKKEDTRYPELLRDIGDAPKQLYYKGSWNPELFERCLAVVGARQMTGYGKRVVEQVVGNVAQAGITVVSGFMYGVDAAAHEAAVRAGGRTVAVMPCGIDRVHPAHQKKLYADILDQGGLILSEFSGTMLPSNWTYPKRNRIVAGLSQATLVVEAGKKSGSLITAGYAKKYNRKLFAVPGSITNELSQGTNQLLREGAEPVISARDILDFFGVKGLFQENAAVASHTGLDLRIAKELKRESLAIDILARNLGVPVAKLGTALSLLQLRGTVSLERGKYYLVC